MITPLRLEVDDTVRYGIRSTIGSTRSATQVQELLSLLKEAGHSDFRDARGPLGFTQRQAGGKFTRDEAAAFITQLQEAESNGAPVGRGAGMEKIDAGAAPAGVVIRATRRRAPTSWMEGDRARERRETDGLSTPG